MNTSKAIKWHHSSFIFLSYHVPLLRRSVLPFRDLHLLDGKLPVALDAGYQVVSPATLEAGVDAVYLHRAASFPYSGIGIQ